MSKLRPVPKICQVKSQSLDNMANKVPVNLRGWVAVAESPHWFAWPDGPTTKNEQCSPAKRMQIFGSQSKKREDGRFLQGGVFIWHAWRYFSQGKGLFLQQGWKIAIKWPLFAHVYEPLKARTGLFRGYFWNVLAISTFVKPPATTFWDHMQWSNDLYENNL